VTVSGNLFRPVSGLACSFGNSRVLSRYLNVTHMLCVAPRFSPKEWGKNSTVAVKVSINNQQFSEDEQANFALYGIVDWSPRGSPNYGRARVEILSPNTRLVLASAGFAELTQPYQMVGDAWWLTDFRQKKLGKGLLFFSCRFGISVVDAFYDSASDRINCYAPLSSEYLVSLSVSFGYDTWTDEYRPFQYYRVSPFIIRPETAPANSGVSINVLSAIHGGFGAEDYADYGGVLMRWAGDSEFGGKSRGNFDSLAVVRNSTQLVAKLPDMEASKRRLIISLNGQQFTDMDSAPSFITYDIRTITPQYGAFEGGTTVYITGINLGTPCTMLPNAPQSNSLRPTHFCSLIVP
jgi:hypothetical protein